MTRALLLTTLLLGVFPFALAGMLCVVTFGALEGLCAGVVEIWKGK